MGEDGRPRGRGGVVEVWVMIIFMMMMNGDVSFTRILFISCNFWGDHVTVDRSKRTHEKKTYI